MEYIEALNRPEHIYSKISLFLAGGITGCPDWQSDIVALLDETNLILLNPRRKNFPIHDLDASFDQIRWERRYLRTANAILFWFPRESICPIALYELGAWSATTKTIFIGTHPEYQRKSDVIIQTSLARLNINIVHSMESLAKQVKHWYYTIKEM